MDSTPFLAVGAWLLTYLLHSTVLLGSVALLLSLAPHRTARFAETAWRVALFGGVVTATTQLLLASIGLPLLQLGSIGVGAPRLLAAKGALWLEGANEAAHGASLTRIAIALVLIWAVIATLRLFALLRAYHAFQDSLGDRTPVCSGPALSMVNAWRHDSGVSAGVRLSVSSRIATPMVLGANEVCLPERALELFTSAELEAAIAHEVAHVLRRDGVWLMIAAVIERALFLQPFNSIAHRRLRMIAECACDDWALQRTGNPVALASALTHVTTWLSGQPVHALAIAMSTSHGMHESLAVARVRRILDPAALRFAERRGRVQAFAAATALAGVVLLMPYVPAKAIGSESANAGSSHSVRYTISAHDDAGPFTLTLQNRQVVGMTINGVAVAASRIHHAGERVLVSDSTGRQTLDLTLTGTGISWNSRPASQAKPNR
jgi:beta-lactamase regulating signal transducer with metallopeptidase domain